MSRSFSRYSARSARASSGGADPARKPPVGALSRSTCVTYQRETALGGSGDKSPARSRLFVFASAQKGDWGHVEKRQSNHRETGARLSERRERTACLISREPVIHTYTHAPQKNKEQREKKGPLLRQASERVGQRQTRATFIFLPISATKEFRVNKRHSPAKVFI